MKTDITKAAAEAAEGALFLGDDGSMTSLSRIDHRANLLGLHLPIRP
jgi:hypothetical protein